MDGSSLIRPRGGSMRQEHDGLGVREVPADAYYGIHTLRALENFPITGVPLGTYSPLVSALASVKQACAETNRELGLLSAQKAAAIVAACEEIRAGRLVEQFCVDVMQGGAGTSANMNANEVIANRGLELLGHGRGQYEYLHPLDDVNRSQSTNDVFPTAAKLALDFAVDDLLAAMAALHGAFAAKADEFSELVKVGRTQLQDAVPMTLGQEFAAFAVMVQEDAARLRETLPLIRESNLGGTAIGTGLNAPAGYANRARHQLSELTGVPLVRAPNLVEATQDAGALVQLSGVLKRVAVKLSKSCNDLRLLASGPRAGLGEIGLPAVQAGSSIMPGKVNPVIPEAVNQIAFEVIGNDVTVTLAAESGQLQLNAFLPVIVHSLMKSITHLTAGSKVLAERCVLGISANTHVLHRSVHNSIALATALTPLLGYEQASAIAQEALERGETIRDVVARQGSLTPAQLDELLQPDRLTGRQG